MIFNNAKFTIMKWMLWALVHYVEHLNILPWMLWIRVLCSIVTRFYYDMNSMINISFRLASRF